MQNANQVAKDVQQNANQVAKDVQQNVQSARRPWYYVLRQARVLLVIYLIALVLFGALTAVVYFHPVLAIDVAITREFQESQFPWLSAFMVGVSYLGNAAWLFIGLILLTAILLWAFRFYLEAVTVLVVCITIDLLNVVAKILVERPRPTEPLVTVIQHATGKSFPSGHVMSYVGYWGLVFTFSLILFHRNRWWRVALLIISGLFVLLVGPSRIYLGDHWASDVLGGYLLGGLWLWLCLWVYTKLKERHVLSSPPKPTNATGTAPKTAG